MTTPYEIVTENGVRDYAEDEYGALLAARTLQRDYPGSATILYEGVCVLTITKEKL